MTYLGEGGLGSIHIYDIIHVLVTYCQYTYITCAKQELMKLCLQKLTRKQKEQIIHIYPMHKTLVCF
jgi:hypothetical protein